MPALKTKFGYLPEPIDQKSRDISVSTLPDIEQTIFDVNASGQVSKDWIYAPPRRWRDFISREEGTYPYSGRIFGLPFTHEIEHRSANSSEHLDFIIWCLGFFMGIRLTASEAGFLDATPIKSRQLTDFIIDRFSVIEALHIANKFWKNNQSSRRNTQRVKGIIHSLFLSQNPNHLPYERFSLLYMALDACFALTKDLRSHKGRLTHSSRIEWMCSEFGIPAPDWAKNFSCKRNRNLSCEK